ncbi:putative isoprenylcysteine alpha-carbonyl methylesterase ICME, partial [Panicum miliaceum]
FFRVGYRWISQLIALLLYAVLLMPGFIKVGYYYFFSSQVCRSVVYGEQPRNSYKAWGALLGRRLAERGIIVACIDYRNFPQGTISDMVTDASEGISFVCNNVVSFGGDPNKYNIQKLVDHFHERGLYRSIFLSIMEGEESLPLFSPEIVTKKSSAEAIALLPEIVLMHGTADYSIPSSASETFVDVLKHAGGKVKLQLYEGKTHTDVFLQDPLRGGRDQLVEDVISVIHADDAHAREKDALAPTPERLACTQKGVSPRHLLVDTSYRACTRKEQHFVHGLSILAVSLVEQRTVSATAVPACRQVGAASTPCRQVVGGGFPLPLATSCCSQEEQRVSCDGLAPVTSPSWTLTV